MGSNFCERCGSPLQQGVKFCVKCGAAADPVYPNPAFNTAPPQYARQPYAYPQKKSGTTFIILSVIFLVLAAGIFTATLLFTGAVDAKAAELNGNWDAVVTLERVNEDNIGYADKEAVGEQKDTQMLLSLDNGGDGTMVISGAQCTASYNKGKIVAESSLGDGVLMHFEGILKQEKGEYMFEGTWKMVLKSEKGTSDIESGSWIAVLLED